jgi:hypothetical protein
MVSLKRLVLVSVLLSVTFKALAPSRESIIIPSSEPINPYKRLIYAIGMIETRLDTLAFNPVEQAVGYFQIRPIRIEDYNKRTGSNYKLKEMFNYDISEKIFLYYAHQLGPYNFEKISRRWNGSGPKTYLYWNRVKKHL